MSLQIELENLTKEFDIPKDFIEPTKRYLISHRKRRPLLIKNFFKKFSNIKIQKSFISKNLKFRNNFNISSVEGARIRMHIRGDGGIDKNGHIFYFNSNRDLLNNFILDFKKLFGDCIISPTINKVYISKGVSKIFIEEFDYIPGLEIAHDLGIDWDILNSKDKIKSEAIKAYFDDEARFHANTIEIVRTKDMSFVKKDKLIKIIKNPRKYYEYAPRLLLDLKIMLKSLKIETSVPFFYKGDLLMHVDNYGYLRLSIPWRFLISGEENLRRYYDVIGFESKNKSSKLKKYLDNIKIHKARKNQAIKLALKNCENLQKDLDFITVSNLSKYSKRSIRQTRRWIKELKNMGKLKLVRGRIIERDKKGIIKKGSGEFIYKLT